MSIMLGSEKCCRRSSISMKSDCQSRTVFHYAFFFKQKLMMWALNDFLDYKHTVLSFFAIKAVDIRLNLFITWLQAMGDGERLYVPKLSTRVTAYISRCTKSADFTATKLHCKAMLSKLWHTQKTLFLLAKFVLDGKMFGMGNGFPNITETHH